LVPAGSVAALADAIVRILGAPAAELTLLGRAGAERVGRQHDAAREAARLAELFARHARGADVSAPAALAGEGRR